MHDCILGPYHLVFPGGWCTQFWEICLQLSLWITAITIKKWYHDPVYKYGKITEDNAPEEEINLYPGALESLYILTATSISWGESMH